MARTKVKPKSWSIMYFETSLGDDTAYSVQYEWQDDDGVHEITNSFSQYGEAYGWLAERVVL